MKKKYQKPELKKLNISIAKLEGARLNWAAANLFRFIKQKFENFMGVVKW